MKKHPDTTPKARACSGYCKHLRPFVKRIANKATRKRAKLAARLLDTDAA